MDKTIIARDGTKIKFRRGQARDARALAVLFDMSSGNCFSKEYEAEGHKDDGWIDKTAAIVQDPKSDIWYGNCIVSVINKQIAGMLSRHVIPQALSNIDLDKLDLPQAEKNILKIQKTIAGQMWFRNLAVFPHFSTNLQLGKKLVNLSLKECFEDYKLTVYFTVHETNTRAQLLYHRIGFQLVDSFPVGETQIYKPNSKWILMKMNEKNIYI